MQIQESDKCSSDKGDKHYFSLAVDETIAETIINLANAQNISRAEVLRRIIYRELAKSGTALKQFKKYHKGNSNE
jgi:Ribbon-helix-helix protein, copG family